MNVQPFPELLKLGIEDDSDAIAELMDQFGGLVRSVIGSVCRETTLITVGDVESLAWTKVWLQLDTFRGSENAEDCQNLFAAWVSRVAHNVALDELRKARAQKRGGKRDAPAEYVDEQVPADGKSPSSIVRGRSQANRLRIEIDKLEPLEAEVIRLVFYESMTINTVAEHTQLSVDKVRGLVERTLNALRIRVLE